MYFFVDYENKIIFGWSAKCGCTHIKAIIRFLINNEIYTKDNEMTVHDYMLNRELSTTIIISKKGDYTGVFTYVFSSFLSVVSFVCSS